MGTKYSSNATSGYNATPPADDGTVAEANKVKWSTIKTKLADPVKDLSDTINTELVTHFDRGPTALTTNTTLGASHYNQFIQVSGSGVTLTLTDANTLTAGWFTDITSTDTSNNVTLARATAANTIDAVSADVTIRPLETLRIYVNAAATGFFTHHPTVPLRSGAINEYKGADIASAATTDIGAATGNFVDVTGTTTITALGTVQAGTRRIVRFTGALTLTHNATSLILPTSANITTANGDVAEFVSLGGGNWKCSNYIRQTGAPIGGSGLTRTILTSGSGTHTWGLGTKRAIIRLIGGGGGSGGGPGGAAYGRAGAGGAYLEKYLNATLAVSATYAVGAGGSGATGAAGSTTFTFNAVTYTAAGGDNGADTDDANNEPGAAAPTTGDLNVAGYSTVGNAAGTSRVGADGPHHYGVGGAAGAEVTTGYGNGTGAHNDAASHSGRPGVIIVDEFD